MKIEKTLYKTASGKWDAIVIIDGEIAAEYRDLSTKEVAQEYLDDFDPDQED